MNKAVGSNPHNWILYQHVKNTLEAAQAAAAQLLDSLAHYPLETRKTRLTLAARNHRSHQPFEDNIIIGD